MKSKWMVSLLMVTTSFTIAASSSFAQKLAGAGINKPEPVAKDSDPNPAIADPAPLYVRPTERQKLRTFEFDAFGPYAFATAAVTGGVQQGFGTPPEWGQGIDSYGARVASNYGIQLITVTTHYGLAEALREDAIYYPCGCKGFVPRIAHALISTVTARRGHDGHTTLSISGIVAPYAGTMASLAWYPARYGVKDGFREGNYNLAGQAAWNLGFEFIYGGPHAMFGKNHVSRSSKTP